MESVGYAISARYFSSIAGPLSAQSARRVEKFMRPPGRNISAAPRAVPDRRLTLGQAADFYKRYDFVRVGSPGVESASRAGAGITAEHEAAENGSAQFSKGRGGGESRSAWISCIERPTERPVRYRHSIPGFSLLRHRSIRRCAPLNRLKSVCRLQQIPRTVACAPDGDVVATVSVIVRR